MTTVNSEPLVLETKEQVYAFMNQKEKEYRNNPLVLKVIKFLGIAYVLYSVYSYIFVGYYAVLDYWLLQIIPLSFIYGMYKAALSKKINFQFTDVFSIKISVFYVTMQILLLNLYWGDSVYSAFQWIAQDDQPTTILNIFLALNIYFSFRFGRMVITYIKFSNNWEDYKKFKKAYTVSISEKPDMVKGLNFEIFYQGKTANYIGRESIFFKDGRMDSHTYSQTIEKEKKQARADQTDKNNKEIQDMLHTNQKAIESMISPESSVTEVASQPLTENKDLHDKLAEIKRLKKIKESESKA